MRKFKDVFEILDDDHSGEMDAKGEIIFKPIFFKRKFRAFQCYEISWTEDDSGGS